MEDGPSVIVISAEPALELVREQFPGLGRTIEHFGSGWDNTAYLVDGDLVFRFPRRSIAVPLIATEARVLPKLAPRLPLPIPCPEWLGAATERFPWPFGGYRRLPGRPMIEVELSPEERRAAAGPWPPSCARCTRFPPAGWSCGVTSCAGPTSSRASRCSSSGWAC